MFYEFVRPLICPFGEIEKFVPSKGEILDVGCGHGLFSKILAERSLDRQVTGIDPSEIKIRHARKYSHLKNLKFEVCELSDLINRKVRFDCIIVIDVLYLFPRREKGKFFEICRKLLKKNGSLIVVENGNGSGFIYKVLKIEETIMTRLFKFTFTKYEGLHFLSRDGYKRMLTELGFGVKTRINLKSFLPYPHFLLVVTR